MLARMRYAKHKGSTIPIFFLFLVLVSLSCSSVTANCGCCNSSSQTVPASFGFGPIQDGEVVQLEGQRSANSIIIPLGGEIYGYVVALNWQPNGARWVLKNPSNEIVHMVDSEMKVAGTSPELPWWWPFKPMGMYIVAIEIPDIKVPAFPNQGGWKLELYLYDKWMGFLDRSAIFATWQFNVGESSFMDNLFAPIYFAWGGIEPLGLGQFTVPLPCIFWLTSPVWALAILFIALAFYKKSIRLAIALIKESGRRFKEGFAKKI